MCSRNPKLQIKMQSINAVGCYQSPTHHIAYIGVQRQASPVKEILDSDHVDRTEGIELS